MFEIYAKDKCPEYVYKYCTTEVYEKFIRHGSFLMGTHAGYRDAYESIGAEYGDHIEGNPSIIGKGLLELDGGSVGPEGALLIDHYVNAYIFSVSLSYSKKDHGVWHQRTGCNYDLCLKIRAEDFFIELAHKTRFQTPFGRSFMLAKPIYNNGYMHAENGAVKKGNMLLCKSRELEWEKEYRLICKPSNLAYNQLHPISPKSLKARAFIEDIIEFSS